MTHMTADDLRARGYDPETGRRVGARVPAKPGDAPGGRGAEPIFQASADTKNGDPADTSKAGGRRTGHSGNGSQPRQSNKFGAVRTVAPASWGGERLADSKAGAELARTLETLKAVGTIIDWWEEVSLPIGTDEHGKVIRYRADAMVLLGYVPVEDGNPEPAMVVRFIDRKRGNMDTRTSAAKRAALRARGLNVEVRS